MPCENALSGVCDYDQMGVVLRPEGRSGMPAGRLSGRY